MLDHREEETGGYFRNCSDLIKRALLKDRILIFNTLQLYQLEQISSKAIAYMVKHVRCATQNDHTAQKCLHMEAAALKLIQSP